MCLTPSLLRSMKPYETDNPNIIVKAGMATGKSTQEANFLNQKRKKHGEKLRVVKVVHRTTFKEHECSRLKEATGLPFVTCDDVVGPISLKDTPFIVIQYENLHRLAP